MIERKKTNQTTNKKIVNSFSSISEIQKNVGDRLYPFGTKKSVFRNNFKVVKRTYVILLIPP